MRPSELGRLNTQTGNRRRRGFHSEGRTGPVTDWALTLQREMWGRSLRQAAPYGNFSVGLFINSVGLGCLRRRLCPIGAVKAARSLRTALAAVAFTASELSRMELEEMAGAFSCPFSLLRIRGSTC
jgi:hypothetical protein